MSMYETSESQLKLKHLGFLRVVAINAAVVVSNLYDYASQNSGLLKPVLGKVEHAVAAVVGPVYSKFKGVPDDILVFVDNKVDEGSRIFDERAPPAAKSAVSMVTELVKVEGPVAAISLAAKICKDFTVTHLAIVWYKANQYPAVHGVLGMAIPTAAHWSQKYNSFIKDLSAKGYSFFRYVPLVPVQEMEKAYKQVEDKE